MTGADAAPEGAISTTAAELPQAPAETPPDSRQHERPPPAGSAEVGGPKGPEPTRYGDWERKGRCIDF